MALVAKTLNCDAWLRVFSFLEPRDCVGAAAAWREAQSALHRRARALVLPLTIRFSASVDYWFIYVDNRVVCASRMIVDVVMHSASWIRRVSADPRVDAPSRRRVVEHSLSDPFDPVCVEVWARISRFPEPERASLHHPNPPAGGVMSLANGVQLWSGRREFDPGVVLIMGRHPDAECGDLSVHGVWRDGLLWKTRDWTSGQWLPQTLPPPPQETPRETKRARVIV